MIALHVQPTVNLLKTTAKKGQQAGILFFAIEFVIEEVY